MKIIVYRLLNPNDHKILICVNVVFHDLIDRLFAIFVAFVKAQLLAFTPNKRFSDSYKACSSFLSKMKRVAILSRYVLVITLLR